MKIYVASSWCNERQPEVVARLREEGHNVYDFRNPAPNNHGFHWSDIDPMWQDWTPAQFCKALDHDLARGGFLLDFEAMNAADVAVMVMPCGRSAHLEAGFFVGMGKPLVILLSRGEPEIMYQMALYLCVTMDEMVMAVSNCQ